ncbi:MAG: hydrogenase maturation nickel metallochaperone HypA, partial [Chitinophagaceae bacterium]
MHEVSLVRNMFSLLEETYPGRLKDIRRIHLRA